MGSRAIVRGFAIAAAVVLAGFGTLYALGGHTARVKQKLTATSAAPSAKGNAKLIVHGSKKGKFGVTAVHLQGGKQFDVVVGGVKVGQMTTNSGGTGTVHFSTTPGGTTGLLGFDPRGSMVVVRADDTGDDVLVGQMPEPSSTDIACCLPEGDNSQGDEQGGSQGNSECEEMSAAECMAEGGMPPGVSAGTTASCIPNPCSTTPPPGGFVVCCTNSTDDDESEAECEEVATQADCAGMNGMVSSATSCDGDPCAAPPPTDLTACCMTQTDDGETETECRVVSAATCTAAHGTPASGMSCEPDPCPTPAQTPGGGGGDDDGGGGDD